MEVLGILAGVGHLPVEVARAAKNLGYRVVAVGLIPGIDKELAGIVDAYFDINVGRVGKIISTLKKENVTKVTMIGKVTKEVLHKIGGVIPDLRAIKILSSIPDHKDDTIMLAIVKELEGEGLEVMDQKLLIKSLLPAPGVMTKRKPTAKELADMEFGFEMAKAIGGLDIGQTVVVKDRSVMAVEAIEGTDQCILRGGFLGKGNVIVAKTAKPKQDQRFDIPAFGKKTMESMITAGATGIVIEAGSTLFVDKEQTIFGQYNMPYYQKLLEGFGMKKAYDSSILEFDIEKLKEKIDNEYIRTLHDKYNLKINDINLKKLDSECKDICKIFAQETLSKEYMRNPSVKIVEEVISKLSKLINPELVKIIREEDTDMPVAFMLALPDYYEALRKMDGKVSILKDREYKKSIDRIRCAVMYVIPQYQGAGLIKYLLSSLVDEINKNNIKYLESGLIPEDNVRFLESLSRYGGDVIKEYRVFGKEI